MHGFYVLLQALRVVVRLVTGGTRNLLAHVDNLAVLVHHSPLREGFLALRAGGGQSADRGVVGVHGIRFLALSALYQTCGPIGRQIIYVSC